MSPLAATLPSRMRADPGAACPACGAQGLAIFHEQEGVPVHSCRLLPTRVQAERFPLGSIRLGVCPACGFITNTAFDPSLVDYSHGYEESQAFSPHFRRFLDGLARGLVERYDLRGKDVLEIGCGKGEFLALICELGENRGIGIDPALDRERITGPAADRIALVRECYSEAHADLPADLVACRHTLEHIHAVGDFLQLLRRGLDGRHDTIVFFEVPDIVRILREAAFWDVYYEHSSYFSAGSLARLFRSTGFEVLRLERGFDGQYLLLESRPGADADTRVLAIEESAEQLLAHAEGFRASFAAKRTEWQALVERERRDRSRVAVWGAGSKGVAFLTTLGLRDDVEYVVDINPHKQGMYMPVTGQPIVGPELLAERKPDIVLLMNPVYEDEVRDELDRLGVRARLLTA